MRKIFISYRRSEAEYPAGALYRELRRRFGDEQVFRDKEDIGGGAAWKQQLLHEIDRDSALLVLMGREWADIRDGQGRRRLDNPDDGLRLEISDGIKDGAAIIPVLLENAEMPDESELPPDLRRLADFNALKLRDSDWERDIDLICRTLVRAGFRELEPAAAPQLRHPLEPVASAPARKKGFVVMAVIAGLLLLCAYLALASDTLDREGHLGVAIFCVPAGVLGIFLWRNERVPAAHARTVGMIVSVLSLLGFLAGIGGMDKAAPSRIAGTAQQLAATPPLTGAPQQMAAAAPGTTPVRARDAMGTNVPSGIGTTELRAPLAANLTTLELLRGHALIRFDPAWRVDTDNPTPPGSYQYVHGNGEVFFKVISERIQIAIEQLAEIGVMNARKADPNTAVTRRGTRRVNGLEMALREFEATVVGIPLTFYVHYYSDPAGSIQLVGWTGRSLVDEHRPLIEQFVAGFEVARRSD